MANLRFICFQSSTLNTHFNFTSITDSAATHIQNFKLLIEDFPRQRTRKIENHPSLIWCQYIYKLTCWYTYSKVICHQTYAVLIRIGINFFLLILSIKRATVKWTRGPQKGGPRVPSYSLTKGIRFHLLPAIPCFGCKSIPYNHINSYLLSIVLRPDSYSMIS